MAKTLQTPIINKIIPFDPKEEYTVSFSYSDNQSVKNYAIIHDAETYDTVYSEYQLGMSLTHIIPAGTLTAGKKYVIQIQVFDNDGNSSNLSDQTPFYCYSTPTFIIENIEYLVKNSSISPSITYSQTEGELIRNFQFFLYDQSKVVIKSSPIYYSLASNSYTFYTLENKCTYYVRATGETENGIYLDTGYIQFSTSYETISASTVLTLENNYTGGYITVTSNIKDVKYEEKGCTIVDGVLVIKDGFLEYNEGFQVDEDLYLALLVQQIPLGMFLRTNNSGLTLSLIKLGDAFYIELKVGLYVLYKEVNATLIENNTYALTKSRNPVYIEIIRKDNIYDIRTEEA